MTKAKKFKVKGYYLAGLLVLVLLLLLIGIYFLTYPVLKNTQLYKSINNVYQENVWTTFTSERAKFSFKHPQNWPVTPASDEQLRENNQDFKDGKWVATDNEIENIDFQEEWVRNAGGPRLGFITVNKTNYKNLEEYVNELSKEQVVDMYVKGTTQKVTIKPPKIEYLKIGGVDAIGVTDTNSFASFSNEMVDYRSIRNGWLYRFVTTDSSHSLENKEKNSKAFQKIISSVKFLD
jgi:hypothetical protein